MSTSILSVLYFCLFCLQHPKQSRIKRDLLLKPTSSLLIITGQKSPGSEQGKEDIYCHETFKKSESVDNVQRNKQALFKKQGWTPLERNPVFKPSPEMERVGRTMGYYKGGIYYTVSLRNYPSDDKQVHIVTAIHHISTKLRMKKYFKEYTATTKKP